MSWSYSVTDLASSQKDQVRLLIADTDTTAQLLQDEEIVYNLSQENNVWGAAARSCEQIGRNFLRKADVRIGRGGTTLTYSVAAKQYADMAKDLRARAIAMNVPWSGGRSISDKENLAADPSLVQPLFTKGMGANPWVGGESNDDVIADQDDT